MLNDPKLWGFLCFEIVRCVLQFSFLYIKKSRIVCVVQILFVLLHDFCMVHTMHLTQKYTCSVDKWVVKVVLTVKRAIY